MIPLTPLAERQLNNLIRQNEEIERLRSVLQGIQEMAADDIRTGMEGRLTHQIEADARAALYAPADGGGEVTR